MRTIPLLLLLGLVALPRIAVAVVIEIPLPELAGTYGEDPREGAHVATFHLPGPPAVVHAVSVRVRGTAEVGVLMCLNDDGSVRSIPWRAYLWGETVDTPVRDWWFVAFEASGSEPPATGAFDWTGILQAGASATWAFLDDGAGTIELSAENAWDIPCWPGTTPPPRILMESVTVTVDADFAVPAPVTSWGRIKAAYR